jgi:hypothetical protein
MKKIWVLLLILGGIFKIQAQSKLTLGLTGGISSEYLASKSDYILPLKNITGFQFGVVLGWRKNNWGLQTGLNGRIRQGGLIQHSLPGQHWTQSEYQAPLVVDAPELQSFNNLSLAETFLLYNYSSIEVPLSLVFFSKPNTQGITLISRIPQLSFQLPVYSKSSIYHESFDAVVSGVNILPELPGFILGVGGAAGFQFAVKQLVTMRVEAYGKLNLQNMQSGTSDRWLTSFSTNNPDDPNDDEIVWESTDTSLKQWSIGLQLTILPIKKAKN